MLFLGNEILTFVRERRLGVGFLRGVGVTTARKSISLEALVRWTYSTQRVIEITGKALLAGERHVEQDSFMPPVRRSTLDGLAAVGRIAELGCWIDNDHQIRGLYPPVHADAETVHDAVLSLPTLAAAEVVRYGRGGDMPDHPGPPKLVPVREHNGRRFVTKQSTRYDLGLRCTLSWCPVVLVNGEEAVAAAFAAYQHWWGSLYLLLEALLDVELKAHEVYGMDAGAPRT